MGILWTIGTVLWKTNLSRASCRFLRSCSTTVQQSLLRSFLLRDAEKKLLLAAS